MMDLLKPEYYVSAMGGLALKGYLWHRWMGRSKTVKHATHRADHQEINRLELALGQPITEWEDDPAPQPKKPSRWADALDFLGTNEGCDGPTKTQLKRDGIYYPSDHGKHGDIQIWM